MSQADLAAKAKMIGSKVCRIELGKIETLFLYGDRAVVQRGGDFTFDDDGRRVPAAVEETIRAASSRASPLG